MFQEKIDLDALLLLIVKSTNFPHSHGFGRLNTMERIATDVPRVFQAMLNNTTVLGNRFYDHIGRDVFNQRPTIDYRFKQYVNIAKSSKRLTEINEEGVDDSACVADDLVVGGDFYTSALAKFPGGDEGLHLGFGFYCYVAKGKPKKDALESSIYAEIFGRRVKCVEESRTITFDMPEDRIYIAMLDMMGALIPQFVENQGHLILKEQAESLNKLVIALAGKKALIG